MQIKINSKHFLICLLLCFMFLTSYTGILNTNNILSSDVSVLDISSVSGENEHSSMDGGSNIGHEDYISAANTSIEFYNSSLKPLRGPGTKTSFDILTAIIAAQMACLIRHARLSDQTYTQLNSSIIIKFLHKKDGMK